MWRDRILAAQKERGVSIRFMAEYARMSEKTVTRILNGKTQTPYVGNVIELGASVGLSPQEIFSETGLVVGNQGLAALQADVERLTAELDEFRADNARLVAREKELTAENDMLRFRLEHKEEILKHKEDIISLLRAK